MPTQCISDQLEFEGFDGHKVVAAFDGGTITSDAGAVLLPRPSLLFSPPVCVNAVWAGLSAMVANPPIRHPSHALQ